MPETDERKRTYGQWWDTTEEMVTASLEGVERVSVAALEKAGARAADARFLVELSLDKALQGDHARGMGRILDITRSAKRGSMDLRPALKVLRDKGATALVGADRKANATLVCKYGMEMAIAKAREHGIGWVGAQAAGGVLTPYAKLALDQGMIGMVMAQSLPCVAPLGGMEPILGNAPTAIAIPVEGHDPVVMDTSMTHTSASGVFLAAQQGQKVPEGSVLDAKGNPTLEARDFVDSELMQKGVMTARGSLVPLGGGHKGYALVFTMGLLTYLLTNTSPPWDLAPERQEPGLAGTMLIAVDPNAFAPPVEMRKRAAGYIDRVKRSPRKAGAPEILYPGERSQQLQAEGRAQGKVMLPASHYHGLEALAREVGMAGVL